MGYGTNGLSFRTLRAANIQRLPEFKNAQGVVAHTDPEGRDWSYNDWMVAVCGEVGELANMLKKIRRGDLGPGDFEHHWRAMIADEIADIAIYLDILALQFNLDLGTVIREKFNRKSEQVGSCVRIGSDDDWHYTTETREGPDGILSGLLD